MATVKTGNEGETMDLLQSRHSRKPMDYEVGEPALLEDSSPKVDVKYPSPAQHPEYIAIGPS